MYQLNLLSILLILIAFFVFYNEFNKKLHYCEMLLLAIAFVAILRASYNYIQLENQANSNQHTYEGFKSKNKKKSKHLKEKYETLTDINENVKDIDNTIKDIDETIENINETTEDIDETNYEYKTNNSNYNKYDMIINSEDSKDYLDIENDKINNHNKKRNNFMDKELYDLKKESRINEKAVRKVDSLFEENNKEFFYDVPVPTTTNANKTKTSKTETSKTETKSNDEIKSVFSPKILIGKNNNNNNGFGNTEKQSKWNDSFNGSEFDASFYNKYDDNNKCKGQYDTLRENDEGNLIVKDYKHSKTFFPGYTYVPPKNWSVPQQRPPVCSSSSPNALKLTGIVDRGLPLNVLELNPQGQVADTESSVSLTNVGSMLPNFKYEEQPFSKPYV